MAEKMTYSSLPNIVPPEVLVFQNVLDLFLRVPPNTQLKVFGRFGVDEAEIGPAPP